MDMMEIKFEWLLTAQVLTSVAMAGVIWIIQIVHYPLFAQVGTESFVQYAASHNRLITWVVAPLMLIELLVSLGLLTPLTPPGLRIAAVIGMILLAIIWITTFGLSVPAHTRLADGFDPAAHARLVSTNWIRTVGWTLRALLSIWMLVQLPSLAR